MYIFLFLFIGLLIYLVLKSRSNIDAYKKDQDAYLMAHGVTYSAVVEWYGPFKASLFRVIVDERKRYIYLSKGTDPKNFQRIRFSDVISIDVIVDGNTQSGLGEAVIGGLLFGGVGALAGAMIGKKQYISGIDVVIHRRSISTPTYTFHFFNGKTKANDPAVRSALKFAQDLNSIINVIVAQNDSYDDAPRRDRRPQLEENYGSNRPNRRRPDRDPNPQYNPDQGRRNRY